MLELCNFQLDDTVVKSIETAPNDELKKAKEIIQRIRRRQLYKVAVLPVVNLFYYYFFLVFSFMLLTPTAEVVDLIVMHMQY
jgi:hypothetical protein